MGNATYEIYYRGGLKPGIILADAASKLAGYLGTDKAQAEKIIKATNRVIKSKVDKVQAEEYASLLDKVGMQVEIRSTSGDMGVSRVAANTENATARSGNRDVAVEFNGQSFEYFKIWIVNILLSIITLGIYSAWAKVRNKQYFYGNTSIDGSSFVYTAKPIAILKGRAVAVVAFVVYSAVSEIFPIAGLILTLVFFLIFPWLIVRSLAFNARNSMYRNIRFNFTGDVGGAMKNFLALPVLLIPTLGLIMPYLWYKQTDYIVNNSAYGTTNFSFDAIPKSYYRIFFIPMAGLLAVAVLSYLLTFVLGEEIASVVSMPVVMLAYLVFIGYIAASLGNLHFDSSTLAGHGFTSSLQAKQMVWIYFSNTLGILFSLGLLIPWAKVRMVRYRAECLTMHVHNSLDDFVAAEQENVSALGEQMSEVFDVEIAAI